MLLIAGPVIGLDQLLKYVVVQHLEGGPGIALIGDVLRLDVVRNSGAAFSIGAGGATIVFTVLAMLVSVSLLIFANRIGRGPMLVAAGLLLAGTVGNLVDRILRTPGAGHGHVVDFIHIINFPIFNISDIAITASVVTYLVLTLKPSRT